MNIEFTEDELGALLKLMDAGIRGQGLAGVKNAAVLMMKIEAAVNEHNKAAEESNVINFNEEKADG